MAIKTIVVAIFAMFLANSTRAAELIMFERDGCIWCQRWETQIGAIYPQTPEGQRVPLRKINLDRERRAAQPFGGLRLLSPIRYTPTFVLIEDGREIGRIIGYINDDSFWGLLSIELRRLGPMPKPD